MTKKAQTQRKQQEQQIVNRYSEMTEEQLKAAINEDDQEISVLETKQDQRLIAAGEKLIALKARTKHGQWLPTLMTLRDGKGIPQQTASQWMGYAKDPAKLEKHREAWRNHRDHSDLDSGEDSFEDDFKSFKEKVKQGQQGADHEFHTDDSRHSNFGGKPAEELIRQEIRKIKNATARLEQMAEYAEHIDVDQETQDQLNTQLERLQEAHSRFAVTRLPKPIHPDNPQLEVLH